MVLSVLVYCFIWVVYLLNLLEDTIDIWLDSTLIIEGGFCWEAGSFYFVFLNVYVGKVGGIFLYGFKDGK